MANLKSKKKCRMRRRPRSVPVGVAMVKRLVGNNWARVLNELAPCLKEACDNLGYHVPCPVHGGKDGFRLFSDASETGGGICNTCGAFPDGLAILQWVNGWSFRETLDAISGYIRNDLPREVRK